MTARVRAPELQGLGGWLNTGGRDLRLSDLRGKVVILDFWTFCCINCLHVLDELRPLEREFSDELVIIGVHSPKFVHEADHLAVKAAVERYEVHHPVLDDPELSTWRQYAVRAWPTLVVVDPDGYVVASYSGEGHAHALRTLITQLITRHEIRRGDSPYVAPVPTPGLLRFPSKTLVLADGRILVTDTGHHRVVVMADAQSRTPIQVIGRGERGLHDGDAATATFSEPNGICRLPEAVANAVGYEFVVADTVNHALRGIRPDGSVITVAGTGEQWMQGDPLPDSGPAHTPLSSPWDVVWSDSLQGVAVAMAGIHQLWLFDPLRQIMEVLAGTTNEGLVDGEAKQAWMAQTSGLATGPDSALWLVDAETSSLRRFQDGRVETVVGTGLFDFGLRDGAANQALLQHPLGVCLLPDGSVAIADTYNGSIRRYEPTSRRLSTLASGLQEPSDVDFVDGMLLVTESAAHQLVRIPIDSALVVESTAYSTQRPPTALRPGPVRLEILFTPPAGQKLDDRSGDATHVVITATPPELLAQGTYTGPVLQHEIVLAGTDGVLHIAARAASCDTDAEFPACHVHQQDWGIPVRVAEDGAAILELSLGSSQLD